VADDEREFGAFARNAARRLTRPGHGPTLHENVEGERRCAIAGESLPFCSRFAPPWPSSLLIGLYFAPGIVIALPGAAIGQKFGDKTTVLGALLLMLVGSVAMAFAAS
jgi:MFS family permease